MSRILLVVALFWSAYGMAQATIDSVDYQVDATKFSFNVVLGGIPDGTALIFRISDDNNVFGGTNKKRIEVNFSATGPTGNISFGPLVGSFGTPVDHWVDGPITDFTLTNNGGGSWSIVGSVANGTVPLVPGDVITQTGLRCFSCTTVDVFVDGSIISPLYNVGGAVSGLLGSVTLQNNNADNLILNADGNFVFPTSLADGSAYAVTVLAQPTGQTCTVSNGTGTLAGADITAVAVDCVDDGLPPSAPPAAAPEPVPTMSIYGLGLSVIALLLIANRRLHYRTRK